MSENQNQNLAKDERPNVIDGYISIDKDKMPYRGHFYPMGWQFAYRCPTVKEIARFSAIPEQDTPNVISGIDDMIRKCVKIYDVDTDTMISVEEINKSDKIFFLLLIRDYYIPQQGIMVENVCEDCQENFTATINSSSLSFPELPEKLIDNFDGRIFNISVNGEKIKFYIPTLGSYSRVLNFVIKMHKNSQQQKDVKVDKVIYDKVFMTIAPFLFETGKETVQDIIKKYKAIYTKDNLLMAYMQIAQNINMDNFESINFECPNCHNVESIDIVFPGGVTKLFQTKFEID